jgi:hypothetical protein
VVTICIGDSSPTLLRGTGRAGSIRHRLSNGEPIAIPNQGSFLDAVDPQTPRGISASLVNIESLISLEPLDASSSSAS